MNKKNKKLEFIQKNYAWVIAGVTGIVMFISAIFGFIEYIIANTHFLYYGLDFSLYRYSTKGFSYNFGVSTIFIIAFFFILYCINQIKEYLKNIKLNLKKIIGNVVIILLSNIYLSLSFLAKFENQGFLIIFIFILIGEIICSISVFKNFKESVNSQHLNKNIMEYIKKIPFLIILLLFLLTLNTILSLKNNNSYQIINNEKVIVYSNEDFYLLLDCKIKDEKIIIYKGTQTKIDNNNIKSINRKFEKIEIK